jgi:hypothetical protein
MMSGFQEGLSMLIGELGIPSLGQSYRLAACFILLLTLPCQGQEARSPGRIGMPYDWTHRHVVFSNPHSLKSARAVFVDPRFWHQRMRRNPRRGPLRPHRRVRVDWSVNLGGAGSSIAPGMSPAKYSFDINAGPDCNGDFVAFGLNVAGSSGQATILAYNNLYTEPGGTGFCPGTGPSVKWAYNTGGAINTSPVLSLDGTKVAWVASANPPVFHVLTIGTIGSNGTSAISPDVPGVGNDALDRAISFGSLGDTRSSVFVDYTGDVAYVGSDDGVMHKFSGVFRGVPAEVTTGWPLHIVTSGNHKLAGPVFDSISRNIYYGDDIGEFSYIREVGSTVGVCIGQPAPPCWGQVTFALGSSSHPIVESPIVDSTAQRVYVFAGGDNSGTHAVVLQTDTLLSFASGSSAPIGEAGPNLYAGAFDDNYYTHPQTGFLYVCGYPAAPAVANPVLYRLSFAASGKMNTLKDSNSLTLANSGVAAACSPMTELKTPTGKDQLFFSVQTGCLASGGGVGGCIMSFDITTTFPAASTAARQEPGGTSGIVVDDVSAAAQASSIYFTTLSNTTCGDGVAGGGCAVKLTQSGLN